MPSVKSASAAALLLALSACGASPSAPPCPQSDPVDEQTSPDPAGLPGPEPAVVSVAAPFRGAYVAERLVHEGQVVPARQVFLGDRHPECFHFRWLWMFDEDKLRVRLETLCEVGSTADGRRTDYVSCVAELVTQVVWESPEKMRLLHDVAARGEVAQMSRRTVDGSSDSQLDEDKQNCSVSVEKALWTVADVSGDSTGGRPAGFALINEQGARWEVLATVPDFDRGAAIEAHVAAAATSPPPPPPPR